MIEIVTMDPGAEDAEALIRELDESQTALYPAESNHLDSVDELRKPNVRFVGAYEDGVLLGCGAVKIMDGGYGEIKRMYVPPKARGRGIAKRILADLEEFLRQAGVALARLETGIHQLEAVGLYEGLGYARVEPFGAYEPDPVSIFMEKELAGFGRGSERE
jgi:putative acetyltransferase